ncbi:MAG: hypothetical protein OXG27_08850 [Chloroflexi bacterium]|nr:hypothetical protein [Chloroflexota bacterium]
MEPYQRKLIAKIPSSVRENEKLENDGPFWHPSVSYSDEVRGWAFRVAVQGDEPFGLFEVELIRDGYRMTRIGRGPEFTYHSDSPGPFPFRVRQITYQGASSRWSSSRLVGAEPRPPVSFGISYQPRGRELHVMWWDGWHRSDINGYRAYLFDQGAPPQIVDTGLSRRAVFEIAPGLTKYVLLLGAYRHDLGLGELARAEVDLERQPELVLRVDKYQPSCLLKSGSPMRGYWTIKDGIPPYRVTVGTQEPVTSKLPHGAFEAGCTTEEGRSSDDGDRFSEISVEIEDGRGRRMEGTLEYQIWGYGEPDAAPVAAINRPGPVALQVSNVLVGSTGLGVVVQEQSIDAQHSRSSFVFRWRFPGDQGWNYERDSVEVGLTRVATILLRGLKPNTPYEFQVAVDITGIRPEEIPDGAWSRLHEVRTWPDRIHPRVSRVGTSVTVTWTQGPSEWGYSVVLRGNGESWWKAHVPSGTEMESVVFSGIPMDAAIEVEVMTPPVGAPRWDGYRG